MIGAGRVLTHSSGPLRGAGGGSPQRFDAIGFGGWRHRSNAGGLAGLYPCLTQCPCKAFAADVGKLDLRVAIGLAEDRRRAGHDELAADFGHSSAGRNGI